MKQLLFLLLFPCLALAQYQGNGNQKITLGEQTTADGLVWRGRTSDTVNLLTNKLDTSVYIVLDTATRAMWYYRASTTPKWTRLVDSLNNLQGTLSVAKGGTGSATQNFVDLTTTQSIGGAKTFTNSALFSATFTATPTTGLSDVFRFRTTGNTGNGVLYSYSDATGVANGIGSNISFNSGGSSTRPNSALSAWAIDMDNRVNPSIQFYYINPRGTFSVPFRMDSSSNVSIGNDNATQRLDVNGNARIRAVAALGGNSATLYRNSDGVLSTTSSDINKKHNVRPIIYGLSTINQLNPVNFQWNVDESEDIGFIAQDIQNIIPESIETDWDSNLIFKYEKLIPILTKAIQEQQALIKALEQRILNLENK